MHRYQNLKVWQKAMDLTESVFLLTRDFPEEERFGLNSQIRRSAVSVPSNIAEGAGRNSNPDFIRFLNIATGSLNELETQILISHRLNYLSKSQLEEVLPLVTEVQKMNYALIQKLSKENTINTSRS